MQVTLDNYVLLAPEAINPDEDNRKKLRKVMNAEPLALIEYWAVDPDYDGVVFRSVWQDYRGNTANDDDALHVATTAHFSVPHKAGERRVSAHAKRQPARRPSGGERAHLAQAASDRALGKLEVIGVLQIDPVLRALPEGSAETQRQFGSHWPLLPDDVRDAHRRYTDGMGKRGLTHFMLFENFTQVVAGVDRRQTVLGRGDAHRCGNSVVIDDFDIESFSFDEPEAEPPLLVDADAPLPRAITLQWLQPIRRRGSQILEACSGMQPVDLHQSPEPDIGRQPPGSLRGEQPFRFLVSEAPESFDQHKQLV